MSNNQFLSIEKDSSDSKWLVWERDADTGEGHIEKSFDNELEAFRWAATNDDTEYGIQSSPATPNNNIKKGKV